MKRIRRIEAVGWLTREIVPEPFHRTRGVWVCIGCRRHATHSRAEAAAARLFSLFGCQSLPRSPSYPATARFPNSPAASSVGLPLLRTDPSHVESPSGHSEVRSKHLVRQHPPRTHHLRRAAEDGR